MALGSSEYLREREKRKERYISKVLSLNHGGADESKLIREASAKFEKSNKLLNK